jgi:hypothetical protein
MVWLKKRLRLNVYAKSIEQIHKFHFCVYFIVNANVYELKFLFYDS